MKIVNFFRRKKEVKISFQQLRCFWEKNHYGDNLLGYRGVNIGLQINKNKKDDGVWVELYDDNDTTNNHMLTVSLSQFLELYEVLPKFAEEMNKKE